jgi:hypothetical protein
VLKWSLRIPLLYPELGACLGARRMASMAYEQVANR